MAPIALEKAAVAHRTTPAISGQELHSAPHVVGENEHADEHPHAA